MEINNQIAGEISTATNPRQWAAEILNLTANEHLVQAALNDPEETAVRAADQMGRWNDRRAGLHSPASAASISARVHEWDAVRCLAESQFGDAFSAREVATATREIAYYRTLARLGGTRYGDAAKWLSSSLEAPDDASVRERLERALRPPSLDWLKYCAASAAAAVDPAHRAQWRDSLRLAMTAVAPATAPRSCTAVSAGRRGSR